MRVFGFLFLLLFSLSTFADQIFTEREIKVVAHRGAKKFAPENTLSSLEKAIELGADLVEVDIRQTKDGFFVAMHDSTVNRTTNGSGKIRDMTLEEVKKLDAGSWFSSNFEGERIPTLAEFFDHAEGRISVDLDYKGGSINDLIDFLKETNAYSRISLTLSGVGVPYRKIKRKLPEVDIRPLRFPLFRDLYFIAKWLKGDIANFFRIIPSERDVKRSRKFGLKIWVNLFGKMDNEEHMIKAINRGADFIQADNLDILIPLVK